ncbi:MAG: tetratricopeptide repeat protein [Candidatus Aminicenantes bacterium]|jgi:signal transduction histidine kinase
MKKQLIFLLPALLTISILFTRGKIKNLDTPLDWVTDRQKIEVLLRLISQYKTINPQQVIEKGMEALTLLKNFPDEKQEIRIINNIGKAYIDKGRYEAGLVYLNRGRKQAEAFGYQPELSDALYTIGTAYCQLGNYDLSMMVNSQVLEIRHQLGDQRGIAESHRGIGNIYRAKGDFDRALEKYWHALDLQEKINDQQGIANTFVDIGSTYRQLKKFVEAERYYQEALQLHKKLGNKLGMLLCLNNIVAVLKKKGDNTLEDQLRNSFYLETLKYYQQALQIHQELEYRTDMVLVLSNMAGIYEELEEYQKAGVIYEESLKMAKALGEKSYQAHVLVNISIMYCKWGKYEKALGISFQALEIAQELSSKLLIKRIYETLANIYANRGDYRNAYKYHRKFKTRSDEILDAASSKRIAEMETQLNMKEKEIKIALLKEKEKRQKNLLRFYLVVGVLIFIIAVINFLLYRYKKRAETTARESEEKYRQWEEERLKRNKLESIGMLAGGIAHDFNNILGVIMGYIELGKMGLSPGSPHMSALSKADRAVIKAKDLAQQFLTFSEGGAPVKRVVSLGDIVKKAVNQARNQPDLPPKIINHLQEPDIKINIPVDLWLSNCDPDQITQVVSQLVINSAEAMHTLFTTADNDNEDNGKHKLPIEIIAENTIVESQQFNYLQPGKYIRLSVRDRGEGIKNESLSKIFDPYFSTRDRVTQKGLGLGLTIVYSIIKRHNGHIEVNSKIGKGTTVTIYLPALN